MNKLLHQPSTELYRQHVNPARLNLWEWQALPLEHMAAQGAWVHDAEGRPYLDFVASFGTALLGHRHPRVIEALTRGLNDMTSPFVAAFSVPDQAGQLAEALARLTNGALSKTFYVNSGAEGIEAALKFALATTQKSEFVCFSQGYHGLTLGSLALAGSDAFQAPFPAQGVKTHRLPFGAVEQVAQYLAEYPIAGVVLEVAQNMGGCRRWADDDLRCIKALCDAHGAVLIVDEVLTGFRTGQWFAYQQVADFQPDMVVISKGLTGGAIPTGAVLMTETIYETVFSPFGRANIHTSTFEANLLALIAGQTVINIIEQERLLHRAALIEEQFREYFNELIARDIGITEVRAAGAFISFRVSDSFDRDQDIWGAPALRTRLIKSGVLTNLAAQAIDYINLLPPLTVTDGEIAYFFEKLTTILER